MVETTLDTAKQHLEECLRARTQCRIVRSRVDDVAQPVVSEFVVQLFEESGCLLVLADLDELDTDLGKPSSHAHGMESAGRSPGCASFAAYPSRELLP